MSGSYPIGSLLPSQRHLAASHGVSRVTVSSAFDQLANEGWLSPARPNARSTAALPRHTRGLLAPQLTNSASLDLASALTAAPLVDLRAATLRALDHLTSHLRSSGYHRGGLIELRERIAFRYTQQGTPTTADEIAIVPGALRALELLAADRVGKWLVQQPTYPDALEVLRARRSRLVGWAFDSSCNLGTLREAMRRHSPTHAYLCVDFHNPTGVNLSNIQRDNLARAVSGKVVCVVDETMRELRFAPGPPEYSMAHFLPNAITIGSLSKSVWGGLRVAWIRGPRDHIARMVGDGRSVTWLTPPLEQLIACELLDDFDASLRKRTRELVRNRDSIVKALRSLGFQVQVPDGGLTVWVAIGQSTKVLAERLAREGVRIAPGQAFFADGVGDHFLRIPLTLHASDLEPLLQCLSCAD
jgi:DNA-binding transcriptional MocR family regulator